MLSRRSLVLALACGGNLVGHACAPVPQIEGCCLRAGEAADLDLQTIDLIPRSGDGKTDHWLGRALLRLAKTFDVNPGCGFYDDGTGGVHPGENAFASREQKVAGTEGTVLFGQELFRHTMRRNEDGIAVLAIFAHEFGHIAQFRSGVDRSLHAGQSTVKLVELHADFLAGFYLARRKAEIPDLRLWSAGDVIHGFGDNNFTGPIHHGTPEERIRAMEEGYTFGGGAAPSFATAMNVGESFVRRFS